jgi:hypothetical protein
VVAALWPAGADALGLLARAGPAQRAARRIRAGGAAAALDAWDAELAREGSR